MGPPDGRRPTADGRDDLVAVARSTGADRRSLAVALTVVAVIVVAILKPWADAPAPAPLARLPATPATLATPATAATPATTFVAPAAAARPGGRDPGGQCGLGEAWRVFTIEVDAGRPVSSWVPVRPVAATGLDAVTVPVVRIVADRVSALGFCAGTDAGVRRPITAVDAWAVPAQGVRVPVDLAPLAAWTPPDPDAGRVFLESDGFGSANGGWAAGDYIFVVRHGSVATDADWYTVRIVVSPSEAATHASPPVSPAATTPRPAAPSFSAAP